MQRRLLNVDKKVTYKQAAIENPDSDVALIVFKYLSISIDDDLKSSKCLQAYYSAVPTPI